MAAGKKRMIYTRASVVSAGEHSVISALASIVLTAGEHSVISAFASVVLTIKEFVLSAFTGTVSAIKL